MDTSAEYADYQQRVAAFIAREGISYFSTSTAETCGGEESDPWFSWSPCECCKSPLGGNRQYLYARDSQDAIVQFTICEDCVYYIEYGRLNDVTMARISKAVSHAS